MAINNLYNTPEIFLTKTNHSYPPGNDMLFEEFFLNNFLKQVPQTNRIYLPIQWTCFYISRNYGQSNISDLQEFLDKIPRNDKYFTLIQWDDGIINKLNDLDIKIFSSGGVGDYPIPLINKPHSRVLRERNIFASFTGVINGRHKVREQMYNYTKNLPNYIIKEKVGFNEFKFLMESSIFSLCPRGYGKTSFRINESLNLGSIPVYIYDEAWIPFRDELNFEDYGVLISENELSNINEILQSISPEKIKKLQKNGEEVYKNYFTYESCYNKILKKLI